MGYNQEYCDPFDLEEGDIWMKLEHCGRYAFACSFLTAEGCRSVMDLACAVGYGSRMLADAGLQVYAADRNREYLQSEHLTGPGAQIASFCFDFDSDPFPAQIPALDAVVCFETLEHLRQPFPFLQKVEGLLKPEGFLLLSFPNKQYERFSPDGTNLDIFHLQVFSLEEVTSALSALGFQVLRILGQPICNNACSRQHELREAGQLDNETVFRAFRYDPASIKALSQILAYPQEKDRNQSYSFLLVAKKRP